MPLIRVKHLYRVRYILREPTEYDALLQNPIATITKLYDAYTRASAWEMARRELGLSNHEARRLTRQGTPTLSVEEL